MHKPESALENDSYRLHCDFEKQRDHLISARRSQLVIVKKRRKKNNMLNSGFFRPGRQKNKIKETDKKVNILILLIKVKILWNTKFVGI